MADSRSRARRGTEALAGFLPPVRRWFEKSFEAPSPAQDKAWPVIRGQDQLDPQSLLEAFLQPSVFGDIAGMFFIFHTEEAELFDISAVHRNNLVFRHGLHFSKKL